MRCKQNKQPQTTEQQSPAPELTEEALREIQERRRRARLERAVQALRKERVMLLPMEPVIMGGRVLPGPLSFSCEEEAPPELVREWQQQVEHLLARAAEPPPDGKP